MPWWSPWLLGLGGNSGGPSTCLDHDTSSESSLCVISGGAFPKLLLLLLAVYSSCIKSDKSWMMRGLGGVPLGRTDTPDDDEAEEVEVEVEEGLFT